jgi:hypothetical protein
MSIEHISRPAEFLLVEDNPGDIRLTREALRDSRLRNHLNVVGDGVEAPHHLSVPTPREKPAREGYFAGTSSVDVGPV